MPSENLPTQTVLDSCQGRSVRFPEGLWGCREKKFVVESRGERCKGGSAVRGGEDGSKEMSWMTVMRRMR